MVEKIITVVICLFIVCVSDLYAAVTLNYQPTKVPGGYIYCHYIFPINADSASLSCVFVPVAEQKQHKQTPDIVKELDKTIKSRGGKN